MTKKQCKLCLGYFDKLAKSHIIPKWVIKFAIPDQTPVKVAEKEYPKRSPIGPYDDTILCIQCESQFADMDSYACDALRDQKPTVSELHPELHSIHIHNHKLFNLFCLSLLWRAHVSSQDIFRLVNLGDYHATKIRSILRGEDELIETEYPVHLMHTLRDLGEAGIVPSPFRCRAKVDSIDLNCYYVLLGDFLLQIFVDKRAAETSSHGFTYRSAPTAYLMQTNLSRTPFARAARSALQGYDEKKRNILRSLIK